MQYCIVYRNREVSDIDATWHFLSFVKLRKRERTLYIIILHEPRSYQRVYNI